MLENFYCKKMEIINFIMGSVLVEFNALEDIISWKPKKV
jgi:hypothetical protein